MKRPRRKIQIRVGRSIVEQPRGPFHKPNNVIARPTDERSLATAGAGVLVADGTSIVVMHKRSGLGKPRTVHCDWRTLFSE
jgi:hypothetical protein